VGSMSSRAASIPAAQNREHLCAIKALQLQRARDLHNQVGTSSVNIR
jgi:hypothetical protein